METDKTTLQCIKEQLESKMSRAIVQAIEDGAEIKKTATNVTIDGVCVIKKNQYAAGHAVVLYFDAAEIDALFEPSKDALKKRAEDLRAELTEIENKLKGDEQ